MKRRIFLNFFGLSFLASIYSVACANTRKRLAHPQKIYVSTDGNDKWTGENPSKNGLKGPFATVTRAKAEISRVKSQQGGVLKKPVTIFLRGGTYFVNNTIQFTEEDSGSEETPITYKAFENEKPIISGGKAIKQWTPVKINGITVWSANVPELKQRSLSIHQLWVNGNRVRLCRHPKKGYLKVEKSLDSTPVWNKGQSRFQYFKNDLKYWKDLRHSEIIIMSRWLESRLPIKDIDYENRIISFREPTPIRIDEANSNSSGAATYYIENVVNFLTEPGESFINYHTGQIFYVPTNKDKISDFLAVIPIISKLIEFRGNSESAKFVEHINFEGVTFSHTEWYYPDQNYASGKIINRVNFSGQQASVNVPASILAQSTRWCSWKKCEFSHIGSYALEFASSSNNNKVIDCDFHDLGGGGIKIGSIEHSSNGSTMVQNCHLHNLGNLFHSAVGIWIGKSSNNKISGNHIHHLYYSGISIGWTWGYTDKPDASGNIVEKNHIHHIGKISKDDGVLLNDKGGIYTLGVQPRTVISNNLIHNIDSYNYGACGIYLDEGSSDILVKNNIVHDINGYSFNLHYGRNNLVKNNIFAFAKTAQILYSRGEKEYRSLTFENNIIYWNDGVLFAGDWKKPNFYFDKNVYYNPKTKLLTRFDIFSWQEWKQKGIDANSQLIDPFFVSVEKRNFEVGFKSPALKLGFKNIQPKARSFR